MTGTRGLHAAAVLALALGGCGGGSSDPDEVPVGDPATDPATDQAGGRPVGGQAAASDGPSGDGAPGTASGDRPAAGPSNDDIGVPPTDFVNGFRVSAARGYDADGRLTRRSETRVDAVERDALTVGEFFDVEGTRFVFTDRLELDEDGRLVRSEYVEPAPDGSVFDYRSESVYEHDARGRLLGRTTETGFDDAEITSLEWDGDRLLAERERPGEFFGYAFVYAYDDDSALPSGARLTRWVEDLEVPFDPAEPAPPLVTQITAYAYDWDGPGRMREKRFDYDDDGSVDEVGTYEYDGDGNMIRATFTGADVRVLSALEYDYVPAEFPFYNLWLRIFRFFP